MTGKPCPGPQAAESRTSRSASRNRGIPSRRSALRDLQPELRGQGLGAPRAYDLCRDLATFEKPNQLSQGMEYVLVNGIPVIDQGKETGALPGKVPGQKKDKGML